MQLDKVITPAGFFAPVRAYSLVRDDAGFYLIYTGRAMRDVRNRGVGGAIATAMLDKVAKRRLAQINAVEEQIRQSSAEALRSTKHSGYVAREAIREVVFKRGIMHGRCPVVVVKADRKWTLCFPHHDEALVREFFAPFVPAR
jgi:hypothetical protein